MGTIPDGTTRGGDCVVVGATARSFAESAARDGWSVHAADLFRDLDLVSTSAAAVRVGGASGTDYPRGLPDAIAGFPAGPCVYTGALENHPDVLAAIASVRPLAGSPPEAVRAVRSPGTLGEIVRDAGLSFPDTRLSPRGVPVDGTFLVKPLASAGGRSIRPWRGDMTATRREGSCFQRFVPGAAWSAAFVAVAGRAQLVGTSRPVGCGRACGGRRFAYCGSLDVPLTLVPDAIRTAFEAAGRSVTAGCGLLGCFGIDAIVDDGGRVFILEVNPRPTASQELIERATGWSIAGSHLAACGWGSPPPPPRPSAIVWAKAIVRTPRAPRLVPAEVFLEAADPWSRADGLRAIADIPAGDVAPAAGTPLMTVFACGAGPRQAEAILRSRVLQIRGIARGRFSPPSAGRRGPRSR